MPLIAIIDQSSVNSAWLGKGLSLIEGNPIIFFEHNEKIMRLSPPKFDKKLRRPLWQS